MSLSKYILVFVDVKSGPVLQKLQQMLQQKSSHLRPGGLFSTSQSHLGPLLRSASLGFDCLDADICTATGRTGASHNTASGICSAVFGLISDVAVFQGFKCRAGESEEFFFLPPLPWCI